MLLFDSILTVYNVTATTELIKCKSYQKPLSRINLFDANVSTLVIDDYDFSISEVVVSNNFSGAIEFSDSIQIKLERLSDGPFLLEAESLNEGTVGILHFPEKGITDTINKIVFIEVTNIEDRKSVV